MIFYMDDYRKVERFDAAAQIDLEDERMCVNGNPAVAALAHSYYQRPQELSPGLPADLAMVDVDGFLNRVYGLATQI